MTFVTGKKTHDHDQDTHRMMGAVSGSEHPLFEVVGEGTYDSNTDSLKLHATPVGGTDEESHLLNLHHRYDVGSRADAWAVGESHREALKLHAPPADKGTPDDVRDAEGVLSWVESGDNHDDDRKDSRAVVDEAFARWAELNKDQRRTFVHYVFGYLAGGSDHDRDVLDRSLKYAERSR